MELTPASSTATFRCGLLLWVALNPLAGSISCRSPRVRTITFLSRPPHLLYGVRVALDFSLSRRVVRPSSALYEVSVRRHETLTIGALLSSAIRLPLDSASRRTPLPSAISFPLSGGFGSFTLEKRAPLGALKRESNCNCNRSPYPHLGLRGSITVCKLSHKSQDCERSAP